MLSGARVRKSELMRSRNIPTFTYDPGIDIPRFARNDNTDGYLPDIAFSTSSAFDGSVALSLVSLPSASTR